MQAQEMAKHDERMQGTFRRIKKAVENTDDWLTPQLHEMAEKSKDMTKKIAEIDKWEQQKMETTKMMLSEREQKMRTLDQLINDCRMEKEKFEKFIKKIQDKLKELDAKERVLEEKDKEFEKRKKKDEARFKKKDEEWKQMMRTTQLISGVC